jgi:prophage maintenance system killer protein
LIKNHPWLGGNKRTATILVDRFLHLNGMELRTTVNEIVELALTVEADR